MSVETLAEELQRLINEYLEGDDHTRAEAWNLIADFAVDNAATLIIALRAAEDM